MAPMAKLTFKAILDWFMELKATRWNIHVQASQFDVKGYAPYVMPDTGMVILNISGTATRGFELHDDHFSFYSRIKGVEQFLEVPYTAVFVAVDPDNGIPNLFPYFEDHGNDDPIVEGEEELVLGAPAPKGEHTVDLPHSGLQATFKVPTLGELLTINSGQAGKPEITKGEDGIIRIQFPKREATQERDPFFEPGKDLRVRVADLFQFPTKGEEPLRIGKDSLDIKIRDRRWVVIEGGKSPKKASMPWIDEVYREKRERREALERLMPTMDELPVPEIRSDGASGESAFFPDLDVSKCVFPTKRVARPVWLTVINGGKQ